MKHVLHVRKANHKGQFDNNNIITNGECALYVLTLNDDTMKDVFRVSGLCFDVIQFECIPTKPQRDFLFTRLRPRRDINDSTDK